MMAEKAQTILYIEDDLNSQKLVKRVLERHGYRVFTVGDGLKGIDMARAWKPDLVLIDINLPNMDGHEITTRLRSLPTTATVPIVALTANVSSLNRDLSLAAGCSGFMTKPIDVREFPDKIANFLSGHVEPISDDKRQEILTLHAQRMVSRLEDNIVELQRANRKLRELDRMKSDFIVLISHELRTPINLITGYTHLLNHHKQTELDDSEDQQYLANLIRGLNEGVTRLGDLVGEVISVANIAGGMLDLDLSLIDLSTMMGEILTDFHEVQSARGLTIHVTNVDELPIIEGDKTQLKVALKNLVGNAIKYTPDGGEIYVEGEKLTEMVHFTFSDTGIGIPPEEQSKIFEHFYSLNPIEYHSTSKHAFQGGGLGLGLAITKGVIEAHGGRISVDSAGQDSDSMPGSSFHVFIPLRQSARL